MSSRFPASAKDCAYLWTQTQHEDAQVCYAMTYQFFKNGKENHLKPNLLKRKTNRHVGADVKPGNNVIFIEYYCDETDGYYDERQELIEHSVTPSVRLK